MTNNRIIKRRPRRLTICAISALAFVGALSAARPGVAAAKKSTSVVCKGSPKKPGVLTGKVSGNVVVKGACLVNHGSATVKGSVTVTSNSVFGAISGHNDKTGKGQSNLTVTGNVVVDKGATAFIGCEAAHSPCMDDNQKAPKLNNKVTIGGGITSTNALGVIVHVTKIGGSVTDTGGGGGESCSSMPGIFAQIMSPVFSDYEDDSIGGSLSIVGLSSCWLGMQRDHITKNLTVNNNKMADPDAIEIGDNVIGGNLACSGNTTVWDASDINPNQLYPRKLKLNTVHGKRSGQCFTPSPTTQGGPTGTPGTF